MFGIRTTLRTIKLLHTAAWAVFASAIVALSMTIFSAILVGGLLLTGMLWVQRGRT